MHPTRLSSAAVDIAKGQMALDLGVHVEPGISEETIVCATDLAALLTDKLLAERPFGAKRVGTILNGLGATNMKSFLHSCRR